MGKNVSAVLSVLVGVIVCFQTACITIPEDDTDSINIGLLCPFTGAFAANGFNYERALYILRDQINEADGIAGKNLHIVVKDTHSGEKEGLSSGENLIDAVDMTAIIGPDELSLTNQMIPFVEKRPILEILPGISSESISDSGQNSYWFRIGPTTENMGCTLAQKMYNDKHRRIAVIHSNEISSLKMAETISDVLDEFYYTDKAEVTLIEIDENASSNDVLWQKITETEPDAIALVVSTRAAATVLLNLYSYSGDVTLYLGPNALNQVLLENTPPELIEDAYGISPSIDNREDAKAFDDLFFKKYGDKPMASAYYYYDALAVALLAIEAAAQDGGLNSRTKIIDYIPKVTQSPGRRIYWNQVVEGLSRIRNGEDIDYHGISSSMSLDDSGNVDQSSATHRIDRVENGVIVFDSWGICL